MTEIVGESREITDKSIELYRRTSSNHRLSTRKYSDTFQQRTVA